jgi:hypothetical protein
MYYLKRTKPFFLFQKKSIWPPLFLVLIKSQMGICSQKKCHEGSAAKRRLIILEE